MATLPRFSPEADLLIACARSNLDAENHALIEEIAASPVDWGRFDTLARRHRLDALVFHHLNQIRPAGMPAEFFAHLQENYHSNTPFNLLFARELNKLLAAFEAEEIPVITYKGLVLAATIYGNLSLRRFDDIDLLIHKADIPRVKEILFSGGYTTWYPTSKKQEAACLKFASEYNFKRSDGKVFLDLHWSIVPKELRLYDYEQKMWERSVNQQIAGLNVKTLALVDLLIVLCLHGSKPQHGWGRLGWICDIAALCQHLSPDDWQLLLELTISNHIEPMVYLGLYLAQDLLGAPLPENCLKHIHAESRLPELSQRIYRRLFWEGHKTTGGFESAIHYLRLSAGLRERLNLTVSRIITPTHEDWQNVSIPTWLYYLYRPFRLLKKYLDQTVDHKK